jgi:hypothetical protein
MKRKIGEIWKEGNVWKVQFPKGRMSFKTKKIAMKWVKTLEK